MTNELRQASLRIVPPQIGLHIALLTVRTTGVETEVDQLIGRCPRIVDGEASTLVDAVDTGFLYEARHSLAQTQSRRHKVRMGR